MDNFTRDAVDDLAACLVKCGAFRDAHHQILERLPNWRLIKGADRLDLQAENMVKACIDHDCVEELLLAVLRYEHTTFAMFALDRCARRYGHFIAGDFLLEELKDALQAIEACNLSNEALWQQRRSVPPAVGSLVDIEPWPMLLELAQAPTRADGTIPLLCFAHSVATVAAAEPGRARIRQWLDRVVERLRCDPSCAFGSTAPADQAAGADSSLVISVYPANAAKHHRSLHRVNAWWFRGTPPSSEPWFEEARPQLITEPTYTMDQLPALINRLIDYIDNRDKQSSLSIELIMPTGLLTEPVDAWPLCVDPDEPDRLGQFYPVAVRSYERLYDPRAAKARKRWHQKWQALDARREARVEQFTRRERGGRSTDIKRLRRELFHAVECCLIMEGVPDSAVLRCLIYTGMPIGLWPRSVPNDASWRDEIARLSAARVGSLPVLVTERRAQAADTDEDIFRHLTLFWDDPSKTPPDSCDLFDEPTRKWRHST